jgi:hypothetical protein
MTAAAQVKKLIKPLFERHSDLALVGRWIFVMPVHHFARAILIDSMLDPKNFDPSGPLHTSLSRGIFSLSVGANGSTTRRRRGRGRGGSLNPTSAPISFAKSRRVRCRRCAR